MACTHGAVTENIALLSLLGSTFEPITDNSLPTSNVSETDDRRLSLKHEQQIAEAFAVLLADTNDPSAVGAVCVEEQRDAAGILIRTAVNAGDQKKRMSNFNKIARALMSCPNEQDEDTLLEEIIGACQPRLLNRLRSSHSKPRKAGKPPILLKLLDGMKYMTGLARVPNIVLARSRIALLGTLFKELEALMPVEAHAQPGRQLLNKILLGIEQLLDQTDLRHLLNMIPKNISSWSGCAGEKLVQSLEKIAQYRSAARYLLTRARKDPGFRNLNIQDIPTPSNSASRHSAEPLSVSARLLSRALVPGGTGHVLANRKKFETRLQMKTAAIKRGIDQHAKRTKRVHAEIQLLLYYEAIDALPRLRIICSHKHACLLCNLLIKAHGVFYIRSCHGRMYPRWRIPSFDQIRLPEVARLRLLQTLDKFNGLLEDQIKACINQPRCKIPDPSESIVFVPAAYTPSAVSAVSAVSVATSKEGTCQDIEESDGLCSPLKTWIQGTPHNTGNTETIGLRMVGVTELHALTPGQAVKIRLYQGTSVRFHTRRIHMELTYESVSLIAPGVFATDSAPHAMVQLKDIGLLVQVEWVDSVNVTNFQKPERIIDLDSPWTLKEAPEGVLFNSLGLILKKKDDLVVVRVS